MRRVKQSVNQPLPQIPFSANSSSQRASLLFPLVGQSLATGWSFGRCLEVCIYKGQVHLAGQR